MSRDRTAHRSGRIQTNHNRSRQLRYVSTGNLGCLMQCSLDLLRNVVIAFKYAAKLLVRELLRSSNFRLVSDPVSNVINHRTCCEHIVSQHKVFRFIRSACGPNLRANAAQTWVPWQHRTTNPIGRCRVHQRSMLVLLRFPSCGMRSATELQPASRLPLPVPTFSIDLSVNQPNIARRALSFGVGRAIALTHDWMNGSSRSGTSRLQSLQSYNW